MSRTVGFVIGTAVAVVIAASTQPSPLVCFFLGFGLAGTGMFLADVLRR